MLSRASGRFETARTAVRESAADPRPERATLLGRPSPRQVRWRLASPEIPADCQVTLASPTAPTAPKLTIAVRPRPATADVVIHPVVPDKDYLSPIDPPNRPRRAVPDGA